MIYVIGSGPAGISAAVALVDKGFEVTMLDAGIDLEPERKKLVKHLGSLKKQDWDNVSIRTIKENMIANIGGVDLKYVFGSDYPYRGMTRYQPVKMLGSKMIRSLAKGGLSTAWGASILPYVQRDIKDWPITLQDLMPHYRAVLSFMPHSGNEDRLNDILPLHDTHYQTFNLCKQASFFMKDLERYEGVLKAEGFSFGVSRLAVAFAKGQNRQGCLYCGMCLYGCPYENIYSTAMTLDQLMVDKNFHYQKNMLVEKLVESTREVKILARSLTGPEKFEFHGSAVFLAAGLLSSTRILLQSIEAFEHPLAIRHSEHFQIPLIRYDKTRNITREELHTLTQLSILLLDRSISENTVYMQVYCYNDLYLDVINRFTGPMASILKRPFEEILGRLLIMKGYLHSNISSRITVYLEAGENGRLVLKGEPNQTARKIVGKIAAKFIKNRKHFRALPASCLATVGEPGTGNHSGGSFPMKKDPSKFETDVLGRPYGFKRVHVVDSSVFPTVPATTITLSIMANAHRIASAY